MTAVSWLIKQLRLIETRNAEENISLTEYFKLYDDAEAQALSMEREQMGTCYRDGMWEGMKTSDEKAQTFPDYFTQNYGDEK